MRRIRTIYMYTINNHSHTISRSSTLPFPFRPYISLRIYRYADRVKSAERNAGGTWQMEREGEGRERESESD